ncbi:hypothetical protein [Micromonospora sp. MW-13]|uniref:hypothetical protein n=1 Tax=Micromonospora sp. MW-13 TaxID=2094022 RepID=UPI000FFE627C|nr:hypothetical protein [Micromonospora sp. MW-13]
MRTATVLTAGRWARLVLLLCTLVGLAAMHTLGHGAHGGGGPGGGGHGGGGHGGHDRSGPPGARPAASASATVASGVTDAMGMAFPVAAARGAAPSVTDVTGAAPSVGHVRGAAPSVGHVRGPAPSGGAVTGGAAFLVGLTGVGPVPVPPGGCPVDGCPTAWLLPADDPGAGSPGWSICLAVLGALAAALLVAVLLLTGARAVGLSARRSGGAPAGPSAPPPRPVGLRLAESSVSRT